MGVFHIVMFICTHASTEQIHDICKKLVALKDNCIHPTSKKPYIKSAAGGKDNSPEGLQNGMTHAFVMEFENIADRDYYVHEDPVHKGFIQDIGKLKPIVQVVDFTPGEY